MRLNKRIPDMNFRVRSIDRIPEKEYIENKLEILRFYGDSD